MSARVIALGQRAAGDDGVGPAILDHLRASGARDLELVELAEASAIIPLLASPMPVVIVDAVIVDSGTEGDLVELDATALPRGVRPASTHGLDLGRAVALARLLADAGALAPSIRFIGVIIAGATPYVAGLSPRIHAAVPAAVARILDLLTAQPVDPGYAVRMRRILVTGANKGIGRALTSAILEHADDTFVYLGTRDVGRGEEARASMVAAHPAWADRLEVLRLDVADDASVSRAAAQLAEKLGAETLYGVVNNAGIGVGDLARILDVNTRGVRRICEAMLPLLTSDGRVVNVTSASGPSFVAKCDERRQRQLTNPDVSWAEIEALMNEAIAIASNRGSFAATGLAEPDAYGLSKACANAFTLAFAREHPELRVNACTPGFIETDLTRPFVETSGKSAKELGMKSPREGTRSALHLLFGVLDGNGRYYGSDALRSPLDRYRAPGSPAYTGP